MTVAADERLVQLTEVELCVQTYGDPTDPAVLLIHGAGQSVLSWADELCARLAAGPRFVVRYDSRDAGRSTTSPPGSPPHTLRDLADDAVGLLDALELETAHVVGMSQGAAVAQLVALEHPERVASLVLASATPGGPGHDSPDLPTMSDELAAFFAGDMPEPEWTSSPSVVDYLVDSERPFAGRDFDEQAMRALAEQIVDRATDIRAQLTNPFLLDPGAPWRQRLDEIEAPTLVLHGIDDPLFPIAHGRALAAEIRGARFMPMDGTGHEMVPKRLWDQVVPAIVQATTSTT